MLLWLHLARMALNLKWLNRSWFWFCTSEFLRLLRPRRKSACKDPAKIENPFCNGVSFSKTGVSPEKLKIQKDLWKTGIFGILPLSRLHRPRQDLLWFDLQSWNSPFLNRVWKSVLEYKEWRGKDKSFHFLLMFLFHFFSYCLYRHSNLSCNELPQSAPQAAIFSQRKIMHPFHSLHIL